MKHSHILEETKIWQVYERKVNGDITRALWTKRVYSASKEKLKTVRDTFPNYTLHDETHILNVLDAMGGLLGTYIDELSVGEVELLILAASLHDIGMCYDEDDRARHFSDIKKCKEYLSLHNSYLIGNKPEEWDEGTRQNYLRWRHPFRVGEVLNKSEWKKIIEDRPKEIVPENVIVSVCQTHGEDPKTIKSKVGRFNYGKRGELDYLESTHTDPLFCALLLRLGDILDFDDTRTPQVLYSYAGNSEKSREEWKKHMASSGFTFYEKPSTKPLPYSAICTSHAIEHAILKFLDWVDSELSNCRNLLSLCTGKGSFEIPYEVNRTEIVRKGYDSGNFRLTMDQEQILNLLIGENLYDSVDVFVRELLQNAIDATLLREKLDESFDAGTEEARIDLWEWYDNDGKLWFRIDDRGIGMTKGMIEKFFLKVGKSYYTSDELTRDLRDHGQSEDFKGISRFGIGFLSCFLCSTEAKVSTLYFDDTKNNREQGEADHYGIRMDITGLTGYYVVKNQIHWDNVPERPMPANSTVKWSMPLERDNYRCVPGTSIALCINPGKLGGINLRESAKHWLVFPKMPVYYNGKKLGTQLSHVTNQRKSYK